MNLPYWNLSEEELESLQTYRGALRMLWNRSPVSTVIALTVLSLILGLFIYGVVELFYWLIGLN